MANGVYTAGIGRLIAAAGWATADPRVLLLDAAGDYTFDKDHATLAALDLGDNELNTTNYTSASDRKVLASETSAADNTDNEWVLDAGDPTWTALGPASGGPSVQAAVVYFHVDGTDANDIPFLYIDDGMPKAVNGEDFTLLWNTEGIVNLFQP